MRLITVSNRLPVTLEIKDGDIHFRESIGGLATGISSYLKTLPGTESLWIGWPGKKISGAFGQKVIERELSEHYQAKPVFLSDEAMKKYYNGFCNQTLWPLLHSFSKFVRQDQKNWRVFIDQNQKFAESVAEELRPGDVVWIHDFHLMLIPKMLRDMGVKNPIGYFSHIPFPAKKIFNILPEDWRYQLIKGLSGADLIGFHTKTYADNFKDSSSEFFGNKLNVGVFPISIDFDKFNNSSKNEDVQKELKILEETLPKNTKKLLSVDRLDYIKGIKERLNAYRIFLREHKEWRGKVTLLDYVVPSREEIPENLKLRDEIHLLVTEINSLFGTEDWMPVIYNYVALPFEKMAALYSVADVALVTPVIDGMNLVAKEYVAARKNKQGVLVLGKNAGAAAELHDAHIIDPKNTEQFADSLNFALQLELSEQIKRMDKMRKHIQENNIVKWANNFIFSLLSSRMNGRREEHAKIYADKNSSMEHFL